MGQIVTWSLEMNHCNSMIRLFRDFIKEEPQFGMITKMKSMKLVKQLFTMKMHLSILFKWSTQGLTAEEVKQYIRFVGNRRLEQLG